MLERDKNSHKGDNGKVLIIGGSDLFHGAPTLAALAAEFSGVDMVYMYMPEKQAAAAKTYSLNFIISTFAKEVLTSADVERILDFSRSVDCVLIGPGLGTDKRTVTAIKTLLGKLKVPTVVDASALIFTQVLPKDVVLTPHRGEFEKLTGDEPTPKNVQKWAKQLKATIVVKAPVDIIADADSITLNETGNALMTVGGTGDALGGLITSLIAQKMPMLEACKYATKIWGMAGEQVAETQACLRTIDLIFLLPNLLNND